MDNKVKLIEKIKSQLKSLLSTSEKVEKKFAQVKAGDLMISSPDEELTIGSEVMVLDEQGIGNPLADGKYVLDSGIEIVVEAGKVKEMMKPEGEQEGPSVEIEVESGDSMTDSKMTNCEMAMNLEEKVAMLEEKLAAMMEKMNMMLGDAEMMKTEMSALANSPATEPILTKSVEFRSVEEKKSNAGMPDIQSIREKARKNNR